MRHISPWEGGDRNRILCFPNKVCSKLKIASLKLFAPHYLILQKSCLPKIQEMNQDTEVLGLLYCVLWKDKEMTHRSEPQKLCVTVSEFESWASAWQVWHRLLKWEVTYGWKPDPWFVHLSFPSQNACVGGLRYICLLSWWLLCDQSQGGRCGCSQMFSFFQGLGTWW